MTRYLVTGGCGFIGSNLTDALLAEGGEVRVLDDLSAGFREYCPSDAELMVGSVVDPAALAAAMRGVDVCFHLAAQVSVPLCAENWVGSHNVNLTGTIGVLQEARARQVPVIYASSAAVYGDVAVSPLSERSPVAPRSAYGADKLGCELHAAVARENYGVPTLGLRFFNVYGPRQNGGSPYSGVVSAFCERLATGRRLRINGDGGQTRDLVFVGDVVRAMLAGRDQIDASPAVLNVCTGKSVSVLQLARTIGRVVGRPPVFEFASARIGDVRVSCGDPSLLHASLGIRMDKSLDDGLRETLAFQQRWPNDDRDTGARRRSLPRHAAG